MFRQTPATAYPFRLSSMAASLGVHGGIILLLGAFSGGRPALPERDVFRPQDHKIVYYDFRKKQPAVAPRKQIGPVPRPRGAQVSRRLVIAAAPKPISARQLIRLPAPRIQPNVVNPQTVLARLKSSLPALPAPPKERPAPRVEAPKAPQPNPSPPEPQGQVNRAPESNNDAVRTPRRQVKAFIPPPPSPATPRLPMSVPVLEEAAPSLSGQPMDIRLATGAGRTALSLGAAPPPSAPQAPVANAGNAQTDVVVASVNPAQPAARELPNSDQAGRFSSAPAAGPPSSSDPANSGIKESNLAIGEPKPRPPEVPKPPEVAPPMKTVLYTERVRMGPPSTLSVPLRPGARTLPRNIEARFQGRNVFTMVVPIENFSSYGGDWIMWFADRQSTPLGTPAMRAPVPFRKMEPVEQAAAGDRTTLRVQVAGVLATNGRLASISLLTTVAPAVEQAVIQDLMSWEYKPASRAGTAVDVDMVLEIVYNLPAALVRR